MGKKAWPSRSRAAVSIEGLAERFGEEQGVSDNQAPPLSLRRSCHVPHPWTSGHQSSRYQESQLGRASLLGPAISNQPPRCPPPLVWFKPGTGILGVISGITQTAEKLRRGLFHTRGFPQKSRLQTVVLRIRILKRLLMILPQWWALIVNNQKPLESRM